MSGLLGDEFAVDIVKGRDAAVDVPKSGDGVIVGTARENLVMKVRMEI